MTKEEKGRRIESLSHAVQTAIAWQMQQPGFTAHTPKHLRTGLDTTKAEHFGLAQLLIKKGLITEDEYFDAVIAGLEHEVEFQTQAARAYGLPPNVTFA